MILSAAGETVENPVDVRRALSGKTEGTIEFKVLRDKQERTLSVQLEKGTGSWLLMPDDPLDTIHAAISPLSIAVPKMSIAPTAIRVPAVSLKAMTIQGPNIVIAPTAISVPAVSLKPMTIQVPSVDFKQMVIPSVKLAPMNLEIPKINIEPMKIVVVPRRLVL